jgi:hypothetical protein
MQHVEESTENAGNTEIKKHVDDIAAKFPCVSSCPSSSEAIVQLKQAPSSIISLKSISDNQQKWSTTSSGYQNFFEFGELHLHKGNYASAALHCESLSGCHALPHIMHQPASWCYFSWFCHWR